METSLSRQRPKMSEPSLWPLSSIWLPPPSSLSPGSIWVAPSRNLRAEAPGIAPGERACEDQSLYDRAVSPPASIIWTTPNAGPTASVEQPQGYTRVPCGQALKSTQAQSRTETYDA